MHRLSGKYGVRVGGLVIVVAVAGCSAPLDFGVESTTTTTASTVTSSTSTTNGGSTTTSATSSTTTTIRFGPPPLEARYIVPDDEVELEAKQLASDIAYALTTYGETDDPTDRFEAIAGDPDLALLPDSDDPGVEPLAEAAEPLTYPGRWSRGEVVYPQLGGLTENRVSVMTVTRQTVGSGPDQEFTVVRTIDIRLVMGESGWEFEKLASAGGAFESIEELALAHEVASDPRIEMPDSARLDILDGEVSPVLLQVMLDMADISPFAITVMATGHPYHVFETDRVSHHTVGRAIDVHAVDGNNVIDDRHDGSATHDLVKWLWGDPRMVQVGSPWDVDAGAKKRSFTNTVHQDHIHVAVIGPNDPTWVPAIGDLVWEDLDADGIQDAGEPGVGGVTVRLYRQSGGLWNSTETNGNGVYEFRNLTWGDFRIEIDVPSGWQVSPRNTGGDDAADSDIDSSGVMASTFLDPREHDPYQDAGIYRLASIGDFVWDDLDADGIQDEGEPGFADIAVHLYDGNGGLVATTVTSGDGAYRFDGLVPGVYSLEIFRATGYVPTLPDRIDPGLEDPDTGDSDFDDNGVTETFRIYSGQYQARWDAGLVLSASIGNRVWNDADGDGIQGGGELGIAGVTVRLFSGGTQVASTSTGSDGSYSFTDLIPGVYQVRFGVPAGFVATLQDQGGDESLDSDIDSAGVAASTTLSPGENDTRWDAGFVAVP